jgi:anti-sigma regulatory factor (Ser/Thr protein kinase)
LIATDLKLCLDEIVANLIGHAFAETAEPHIVVVIELQKHVAKAEMRDNGIHFDIRHRAGSIDYERVGGINRLARPEDDPL